MLAGGTAFGVLLFVGYLWRGYGGDLTPLIDQFLVRSSSSVIDGGGQMEAGSWWPTILRAVGSMVGWAWFSLGMVALVALWVKRIPNAGLPLILLGCTVLSVGLLRQWAYVHEYWAYYLCAPVLGSLLLFLQRPLPSMRKAWAPFTVFLVLALWVPGSVDQKIRERSRPLTPAKHEWKVALALEQTLRPDQTFTATEMPSPIFLYYANRDFLIWDLTRTQTPDAFVQVHGGLPKGEVGDDIREIYRHSPASNRVLMSVVID